MIVLLESGDLPLRGVTADGRRDRRCSIPDIAVGGGHLLEVENEAVEETEDEGGRGAGESEEGEISVLYIEHHHASLLVLTPNPPNILAKLSVQQPLLLARRRHFTERSVLQTGLLGGQPQCLIVTLS